MWKKLKFDKGQAIEKFQKLDVENLKPKNLRGNDKIIRSIIEKAALNVELVHNKLGKNINISSYDYDLLFGLELYTLFKTELPFELKFTERQAAQNEIWYYISLKIAPDFVYERYGLTEARYFKLSWRIWLKIIWWYIHISWQGSKEKTYEILKRNTTDDVAQIVERVGEQGYDLQLTRSIMEYYGNMSDEERGSDKQIFRKITKLNTARLKIVEPGLMIGGYEQYVKELFEYFTVKNFDLVKAN